MRWQISIIAAPLMAGMLLLTSCKREERAYRVKPPNADTVYAVTETDFHISTPQPGEVKNDYEENSYALTEGKRLYLAFNCVGCHFHGGGGIGPPLMDEVWIYGSQPQQIFATIVEGRPNGMPSFRGKIPDFQVWQIVAYVRSMSGNVSNAAAPGRDDHMSTVRPENSRGKTAGLPG